MSVDGRNTDEGEEENEGYIAEKKKARRDADGARKSVRVTNKTLDCHHPRIE